MRFPSSAQPRTGKESNASKTPGNTTRRVSRHADRPDDKKNTDNKYTSLDRKITDMTATRTQKFLVAFGTALGCLTAAAGAFAAPNANFTAPSFFGQQGTTYQEWDGYSSAAGPNAPSLSSNPAGTANWYDSTAATDGAFLIGPAPTGHLYSFSGVINPVVTVPSFGRGVNFSTTLILQIEAQGNPIDLSSVKVSPTGGSSLAYSTSNVVSTPISGGFGGNDYVYRFSWDNLAGNATGYTFSYSPGQTSSSQIATRVDTLTTLAAAAPVPEASTTISLGVLLSLGVLGMGGQAVRTRRKAARPA